MIRIEILEGPGRGRVEEFDQEIVNLGRAQANHLIFDNPYISGEHGQIYISGERIYYCDLNSTNGSSLRRGGRDRFFKGDKVELLPGDLIVLGGEDSPLAIRVAGLELGEDLEATRTIVASRSVRQAREIGERLGADAPALSTLFRLVRDLAGAKTRTQMLEQIVEGLLTAYPQARYVSLYEQRGDRLVSILSRSVEGEDRRVEELPPGVKERLAEGQEAVLIELPGTKSAPGTGTGLFAPLLAQGNLTGALRVEVRRGAGAFDSRDLELLAVFAAHASKSLDNIALVEALRASEARLADENKFLRSETLVRASIVGESPALQAVLSKVRRVLPTDTTVLIQGETGTGKELIARAIHEEGPRGERLFVARNCGAFPENLLESELFGHVKGAFTGAMENKRGVFDIADGGTVFLDEVGELPLAMQVKLLRALQEGEIIPVGATRPKRVDVRIISATNRNLEAEVRAGRFREDLYYRLNVFPLQMPPLRERREDIPVLARHFLLEVSEKLGRRNAEIDDEAIEALRAFDWPGNIRQLQNEIERAAITADPDEPVGLSHLSDRIAEAALGEDGAVGAGEGSLKARLLEKEKEIIRETLSQTEGNRTKAAQVLGISRQAFMKKISKYGIK